MVKKTNKKTVTNPRLMRVRGAELDKSIHRLRKETEENPLQEVSGSSGNPINSNLYDKKRNAKILDLYKRGKDLIEIAAMFFNIYTINGERQPTFQKYLDKVEKIISDAIKEEGKQTASTVVKNKNKKNPKNQKKEKK